MTTDEAVSGSAAERGAQRSAPGPGGPAPLLSVVLPVHGVERYLPACLDSVLDQPEPTLAGGGPGIEVVAVDDGSPDRCGEILDKRSAADPRLRVVRRATSAGPGPARNAGLAQARGEYVWFADPDDLLAAGALAAIAGALIAHSPDVLMLDYLILRASGRTERSPGADLLAGPPAVLTLADRPDLVNRTMTVWSKVFRRGFLAALEVPFPPGVHEDVPVSCAALLAARRIALLDRVCYLYRQRPRSFLDTPSMDHFSIFASYENVFARMDASPAPAVEAVRAALFGRAIEHYSTVLASGLIPLRARRAYFRRMTEDFARYRPAAYRPPAGARGLKIALVSRGAYWAYEALAPLNEARMAVRRLAGGVAGAGGSP